MAIAIFRRRRNHIADILSGIMRDPAVQIAGRDGSMSLATPGCTFLDPPTGAAIAANRAYNLVGPGGLVLPMYTAFPAIVNLFPAFTTDTGLASNAIVSGTLTRRITEDTATSGHSSASSAITLTDGVSYLLKCGFRRASGTSSRTIRCFVARSGQRAGLSYDPATGVVSSTVIGGGTVGTITQQTMPDGVVMAWATISNAAWGGAVVPQVSGASGGLASYEGDGSAFDFVAPTLVASTITPLGIAEAATRVADANVWTLPDALTQDEEIIVLSAQCYASGDMGVTTQTWLAGGASGYPVFSRGSATALDSIGYNGSGSKADAYTRTIPNVSVCFMQRGRFRPTNVEAGYGVSLSGSPTAIASGSWSEDTTLRIGSSPAAGRASYALNACIRRKGGFSQAQIDALYYGFANGRTVPVVA
jgi:hypothetical protein